MKKIIPLTTLIFLSGCFPNYKTLQPDTNFTVVDENKQPIVGTEIILISRAYPYGDEKFRTSNITNNLGKVSFNSINEFRIESLMMHGMEVFFWNWCIYKDGYKTNYSNYRNSDDFLSENNIILKKGNSQICKFSYY